MAKYSKTTPEILVEETKIIEELKALLEKLTLIVKDLKEEARISGVSELKISEVNKAILALKQAIERVIQISKAEALTVVKMSLKAFLTM